MAVVGRSGTDDRPFAQGVTMGAKARRSKVDSNNEPAHRNGTANGDDQTESARAAARGVIDLHAARLSKTVQAAEPAVPTERPIGKKAKKPKKADAKTTRKAEKAKRAKKAEAKTTNKAKEAKHANEAKKARKAEAKAARKAEAKARRKARAEADQRARKAEAKSRKKADTVRAHAPGATGTATAVGEPSARGTAGPNARSIAGYPPDDPASGGRQMPAHWGYKPFNVVTQSSPTGSQCIPAVGCAEAGRYIVRRPQLGLTARGDEVTYVSLGEGATSEGEFWESLNTACTEHLPVLFLVADNGYAISVPSSEQSPAPINELVRGFAGLQVRSVDGTDYFAVRRAARKVVSHVRAGVGPALIHARVTRPYSHSAADTQSKYRLPQELEWEIEHDPIDRFEQALIDGGVISADEASDIRSEAKQIVVDAAKAALAAPRPDVKTVLDHVVALPDIPDPGDPPTDGEPVAMGEAIRRALHDVMESDERVRVFGEDVADAREAILAEVEGKGGVFGTTHGLQRQFGRARCYNTPLAEANIIGRAVGQAVRGLRPAPEIQFFDYIWPAMQQVKSEAATIRWRSAGAFTCPTVIRVPIGGYLQGGAIWHSQSGESIFGHVPGLLIAFPSRASDAAGLLRAAFRCEDPVLFLEHKHLLRQPYTREAFPGPDHVVPFGKGRYVTRGDDLTIVTWGATVERCRQAAAQLGESDDCRIEIIDLRTIVPWDQEMVAESVARTSRLLVVHEDNVRGGFGGEGAAWVTGNMFWDLDAPVVRVGAQDCHVAYAPELENVILPQVAGIADAARRILSE